jgi:hypothetical protein
MGTLTGGGQRRPGRVRRTGARACRRSGARRRTDPAHVQWAAAGGTPRRTRARRSRRARPARRGPRRLPTPRDVLLAVDGGLDGDLVERGRTFEWWAAAAYCVAPEPWVRGAGNSSSSSSRRALSTRTPRLGSRPGWLTIGADSRTIVVTASPLLLDACDEVCFVADGQVAARGRHHDLLSQVHGIPGNRAPRGRSRDEATHVAHRPRRTAPCPSPAARPCCARSPECGVPSDAVSSASRCGRRSPLRPASSARSSSDRSSARSPAAGPRPTGSPLSCSRSGSACGPKRAHLGGPPGGPGARRAPLCRLARASSWNVRSHSRSRVVERAGTGDLLARTTNDVDAVAR